MTEKNLFSGKLQVVFRPGRPLLKIVVAAAIVFSMAAMGVLGWSIYDMHRQTENMRSEAAALEYENEVLEKKKQQVDSVQGLLDIAREELGLLDPNTVIIDAGSAAS